MGASVDTGGGGRGKSQNFDLNLVPFIDLLSALITFLLATAVWTQITTMQVDQAISNQTPAEAPPPDEEKPPPMTVHLRADGIWAGRSMEEKTTPSGKVLVAGKNYPMVEEKYDWALLRPDLEKDRTDWPGETTVVINTDDGVHYEHMIAALDMAKELLYKDTLLAGGPATQAPLPGLPPPK